MERGGYTRDAGFGAGSPEGAGPLSGRSKGVHGGDTEL